LVNTFRKSIAKTPFSPFSKKGNKNAFFKKRQQKHLAKKGSKNI
jgi:hypothetical protein